MPRSEPDGLLAGPGRHRLGGAGFGCSADAQECSGAQGAEAVL